MTDKFNINYERKIIWEKDLFLFVNHKTATLCWAKLTIKKGLCDVITFDSHRDFRDGIITQGDLLALDMLPDNKKYLSSKYIRSDLLHFTSSTEFMEWNLLDKERNQVLIEGQHKFFLQNNDNFIDVTFMKNIVKDVYSYYLHQQGNGNSGKCEDINGNDHFFKMSKVEKFAEPDTKFILDIDFDFFTSYDLNYELIPNNKMKDYLELMKRLGQREECIGITIAIEPDNCGSYCNCMKISESFSQVFGDNIMDLVKSLLESSGYTLIDFRNYSIISS